MPKKLAPHDRGFVALGVLESSARIYPDRIIVYTRNEWVKDHLTRSYGGRTEPTRWVLYSIENRLKLLDGWRKYVLGRWSEVETEYNRLLESPRLFLPARDGLSV